MIRRDNEAVGDEDGDGSSTSHDTQRGSGLLDQMIEALLQGADIPPREVEGVDDEFCDCMYQIMPCKPPPGLSA